MITAFDALIGVINGKITPPIGNLYDMVFGFHGVDNNAFKLSLPERDIIIEAIEDPDDGYKSLLECVVERPPIVGNNRVFFNVPIVFVKFRDIEEYGFKGFVLYDRDDHVWLKVGTEDYDDYYPMFIFRYSPPEVEVRKWKLSGDFC